MNPNPRQLKLLQHVHEHNPSTVDELATHLNVTVQTVRRDIQRLSEASLLARFHGGVRMPNSTIENIAHPPRESLPAERKRRIKIGRAHGREGVGKYV